MSEQSQAFLIENLRIELARLYVMDTSVLTDDLITEIALIYLWSLINLPGYRQSILDILYHVKVGK